MQPRIILLSGPIASGKTTLCSTLRDKHRFEIIRTRGIIASLKIKEANPGRAELQAAGDSLDATTGGDWLARALSRKPELLQETTTVVDSVRTEEQVSAIRKAFGSRVVHVHLTAPEDALERRYNERRESELSFLAARSNPTESKISSLFDIADIVIDTHRSSQRDVYVRLASFLGLFGRSPERLVDVLVGGQYGSEGKGQVAAYLAPEYDILIRSGGPNAGHTVHEEPEPYTFHHLPSGTRCSEAKVVLAPGAVINVPKILKEISACIITDDRLYIDPHAMVIEDGDISSEKKLQKTIGSTGQGVGAATARKVRRTAASPKVRLAKDIKELKPYIRYTREILDEAFSQGSRILLEGTQGSGLSLHHGHYPYVTSRDTTVSGTLAEAGIAPSRVRRILLTCRTYPIRVGSDSGTKESGPMNNEITWEEIASRSGIPIEELKKTERTSTTNRPRRVGEFDWELFRGSVSLNGPTDIVLTFADYLSIENQAAGDLSNLPSKPFDSSKNLRE